MNDAKISFVITTCKRGNHVRDIIRSIRDTTPESHYEIVVVSSDPADSEKVKWLEEQKDVRLFHPEERISGRKGNTAYYYNYGVKKATKEWVFPLGDDMAPAHGWYSHFLETSSRNLNENIGTIIVATQLGDRALGPRVALRGRTRKATGTWKDLYLADCAITRKEVIDTIGGYDENIDFLEAGLDFALSVEFLTDKETVVDERIKVESPLVHEQGEGNLSSPSPEFLYIKNKWDRWCDENGAQYILDHVNLVPSEIRKKSINSMDRAMHLHQDNRDGDAIDLIEGTLVSDPHCSDLIYLYAQFLITSNRIDEAEKQLRRTIAIKGEDAHAHNDLGAICERKGDVSEAENHYRIAVSVDNRNYNAIENLMRVLLIQGKRSEAERISGELLDRHPDDGELQRIADELMPNIDKQFRKFLSSINSGTKAGHDELLEWAEECERKREAHETVEVL
jgi:tetratricopeptide (TPR) repeat protein